jgi:hypothetical protein
MTPSPEGPLWSQRHAATPMPALTTHEAARHFAAVVTDLEDQDYLQEWFGYECVDSGQTPGLLGTRPADRIALETGRTDLWPVQDHYESWDRAGFFDAIEYLAGRVSQGLPDSGGYHSYGDCGWHYSQYDHQPAFANYRGQVNRILRRYGEGFVLSETGHIERLVSSELESLFGSVEPTADPLSEEAQVSLAWHKFRQPDLVSTREAIQILVDLLEPYRPSVREHLGKEGDKALFKTADGLWIRHNDDRQRKDYDHEIWWDWLFSLYLSSLRLVQALDARAKGTSGPVAALVSDLTGDQQISFYRGDLTSRLQELDITELPAGALHRLGVAVGSRSQSGTMTVRTEGFEPCARSADLHRWPIDYRYGLVEGAFLIDGQLWPNPVVFDAAVCALNLSDLDHTRPRALALLSKIAAAPLAFGFLQMSAEPEQVASALRAASNTCPEHEVRLAWIRLAERLAGGR